MSLLLVSRIRWLVRVVAAFGWLMLAAGEAPAAGLRLPPINGQLSGEFANARFAGAPKLHWTLTARSAGARRFVHLAVDGAGSLLRVAAEVDAQGNGQWKITDGRFDAAVWYRPFAPAFGSALAVGEASGTIELSGAGTVQEGKPVGTVRVVWADGALRDRVAGWAFAGVSVAGDFALDVVEGTFRSAQPFALRVGSMSTTRFGARNLSVRGLLLADRSVELQEARIEIAGGNIAIDPCRIPLSPPSIQTRIRVNAVGLQDVAALVPAGLTETRGRVSGSVGFGWSDEGGVELGAGELSLDSTEPAMVRLAPAPGFLSRRVPQYITFLPGFAARWFRPLNPAYTEVSEIELGRTGLRVERLTIRLTPDGDEKGRSASVRIEGYPEQADSIVKAVVFEVNVAGPLAAVFRMGLQQKFSVDVK